MIKVRNRARLVISLSLHSGPERVKIKWLKTDNNCRKWPKMAVFGHFLAISAKNMAFDPGRTRYTLEALVEAHRLRCITHFGAVSIFCKIKKCAIFKAFSAKQTTF